MWQRVLDVEMVACLCFSVRSKETPSERLVSKTKTLTGRSGDAIPSLHNTCNKHTKSHFGVSKSERTHQSPVCVFVCVLVCVLSVKHRWSASFLPLYLSSSFFDQPLLPQAAYIFHFFIGLVETLPPRILSKPFLLEKKRTTRQLQTHFWGFMLITKTKCQARYFFLPLGDAK